MIIEWLKIFNLIKNFLKNEPKKITSQEGNKNNQLVRENIKFIYKESYHYYGMDQKSIISNIDSRVSEYINKNFPITKIVEDCFKENASEFQKVFQKGLRNVSKEKLYNIFKPDILFALQKAINVSARTDSIDIHKILSDLIRNKIIEENTSFIDLSINESIDIVEKLNINLIKILSLMFIMKEKKYFNISDKGRNTDIQKKELFNILSSICNEFKDIDVSIERLEYLEVVSCSKLVKRVIVGVDLINIIKKKYQHLYRDEKENSILKELKEKVNDFEKILDIWTSNRFESFSLSIVGKIIGQTYAAQIKFCNQNIKNYLQ